MFLMRALIPSGQEPILMASSALNYFFSLNTATPRGRGLQPTDLGGHRCQALGSRGVSKRNWPALLSCGREQWPECVGAA